MNQDKVFLNEEAKKIMGKEGNVRGEVIRVNIAYIKFKEGKEKLTLLENRLRELGFPLKLNGFKSLKWYPESLSILIILIAKDIFNWQDEDIFKMGNCAPKSSFIVQLLMRHFFSSRKSYEEFPKYWKSHFDFGEIETIEFNEEEKYFIIRIQRYEFHHIACIYYSGYLLRIAQFIIKSKEITINEQKCINRGDPYHEYIVRWQ